MKIRISVVVLTLVVGLMASTAFACFESAAYGTFTLGVYGTNVETVGGDQVGDDGHPVKSNSEWDFNRDFYISSCSHHANFNASVATGKWPNNKAEIRAFFQRQEVMCRNYFRSVHTKFAGQLCR